MRNWHFHEGQRGEAEHLIKQFHYSGRMAGTLIFTAHDDGGLFGDFGPAFAACCFGSPPARWSEDVTELQRLVLAPTHSDFPLTSLISKALQHMKRNRKDIDLLVSFADSTQDHHGGVYQAASWHYHGQRAPRMDAIMFGGRKIPARTCNANYGTSSVSILRKRFPDVLIEPVVDEGKHLYWRALRTSGKYKAQRLGLIAAAYPKPDEQQSEAA